MNHEQTKQAVIASLIRCPNGPGRPGKGHDAKDPKDAKGGR